MPCTHSTATSPTNPTTSSAVRGEASVDNSDDFVRVEIVAALKRGIVVIPVLVQDARMPTRQQLPDPLAELADIQASELSDRRWGTDVRRLIVTLDAAVAALPQSPPARADCDGKPLPSAIGNRRASFQRGADGI